MLVAVFVGEGGEGIQEESGGGGDGAFVVIGPVEGVLGAVGGGGVEEIEGILGGDEHGAGERGLLVGWAGGGADGAVGFAIEVGPLEFAGGLGLGGFVYGDGVVGDGDEVPGGVRGGGVALGAGVEGHGGAVGEADEVELVVVAVAAAVGGELDGHGVVALGGAEHGVAGIRQGGGFQAGDGRLGDFIGAEKRALRLRVRVPSTTA